MQDNKTNTVNENKPDKARLIVNIVGAVLCVLLLPILVMNCILIVSGIAKPNDVPSIGKTVPMIVLTDSMEDTIKSGDLIFCKKVEAKDVKVGDVISYFDPTGKSESVTTHRVVSVMVQSDGSYLFYTKGDNNNIEDITPVPEENLVGRWTGRRIWALGRVILFTQSPLGIIVCVVLPIGAIVAYYLIMRKQKDGKQKDDIDALKKELEALKKAKAESEQEAKVESAQEAKAESSQEAKAESAQENK